MQIRSRVSLIVLAVGFVGQAARADLSLTVTQDPTSTANLQALLPGQVVTFDVNLTGFAGPPLGFLGASVFFDSALLGTPLPQSLKAGPIVPDPSSNSFFTAFNPGFADASYLDITVNSTAPISENGVFFSFEVMVQPATGTGKLSFSDNLGNVNVFASDQNSNPLDISAGPDLPFRVVQAPMVVPEPNSLLVVAFATVVMVLPGSLSRLARLRASKSR
jgi:hypothetical protein